MKKLRWLTNHHKKAAVRKSQFNRFELIGHLFVDGGSVGTLDDGAEDKIIGLPQATEEHTVEQLVEMDMIGLYEEYEDDEEGEP